MAFFSGQVFLSPLLDTQGDLCSRQGSLSPQHISDNSSSRSQLLLARGCMVYPAPSTGKQF